MSKGIKWDIGVSCRQNHRTGSHCDLVTREHSDPVTRFCVCRVKPKLHLFQDSRSSQRRQLGIKCTFICIRPQTSKPSFSHKAINLYLSMDLTNSRKTVTQEFITTLLWNVDCLNLNEIYQVAYYQKNWVTIVTR